SPQVARLSSDLDGRSGSPPAYRETDESYADEHTTIDKISNGEYSHPERVVAFNTHEGWSRDVTEEIALKLLDLSREGRALGAAARAFVERVTGEVLRSSFRGSLWLAGGSAADQTIPQSQRTKMRRLLEEPDAPYRSGPSRTWIKVKNPKAPSATRALDGNFSADKSRTEKITSLREG